MNESENSTIHNEVRSVLMVFERPGVFGYLSEEYLRAFFENGWYVVACFLCGNIDNKEKEHLNFHEVITFGLSKKQVRGLKLRSFFHMLKLFSKRSFDLVISHQYQANSSVGVALLFKKKLVSYAVFHGINPLTASSRKLFYNTVGRAFSRFITVSDAQLENIFKNCYCRDRNRFAVIRNPIDVEQMNLNIRSRQESRKISGLGVNDFVFGTICRLTENKRPLDLLYGLKEIETCLPEAKLLIIGEGSQRKIILDEALRLGLSEKIVMPGYIDKAWVLMRGFDLFVLPSKFESCSLVLLEAMMAKVPIIASKSPGVQETLNGVGYLFEQGNFKEMAEYILTISRMTKREKEQMVSDGFSRVKTAFDKRIFQKNLLALVENDLAKLEIQ